MNKDRVLVAHNGAELPEPLKAANEDYGWPGRRRCLQVGYVGHLYCWADITIIWMFFLPPTRYRSLANRTAELGKQPRSQDCIGRQRVSRVCDAIYLEKPGRGCSCIVASFLVCLDIARLLRITTLV